MQRSEEKRKRTVGNGSFCFFYLLLVSVKASSNQFNVVQQIDPFAFHRTLARSPQFLQAQTKEIRSMILIRGSIASPLGSWEQSVLLRSAYLYGSWYRFARTFFSALLCQSRLRLKEAQLGSKGNTACFPSVRSSIALPARFHGSSSGLCY